MFKVEIQGNTYEELKQNVVQFFAGMDLRPQENQEDPFQNTIPFPEEDEKVKETPTEKKEALPEKKAEPIAEPITEPIAEPATLDDVRTLISKAVEAGKAAEVKQVMAPFGSKPSEFQETDYPEIARLLKELI